MQRPFRNRSCFPDTVFTSRTGSGEIKGNTVMPKISEHRNVLVIRPWLSPSSGGNAYAHFDALAMRETPDWPHRRYAGYRILGCGDDGRKVLRLDRFRFQCQIDDRRDECYAWRWGYQPEQGSIFTARDVELYGPSIAAIKRGLDRLLIEDGPTEAVGRFVVRLAGILKLDGIVLLETSHDGCFRDGMNVQWDIQPAVYGEAMSGIDVLVLELHRACAARVGKVAA